MTTLREAIKNLSPQDRKLIQGAFDRQESFVIRLPENKFLGVNVSSTPDVKIIEAHGYWAYGEFV